MTEYVMSLPGVSFCTRRIAIQCCRGEGIVEITPRTLIRIFQLPTDCTRMCSTNKENMVNTLAGKKPESVTSFTPNFQNKATNKTIWGQSQHCYVKYSGIYQITSHIHKWGIAHIYAYNTRHSSVHPYQLIL